MSDSRRPVVLVVDDDADFRQLVLDILGREELHLLAASSAEEALAVVARGSVDLVLTDQRMPGMDGLDLVRRLRAASPAPAVLMMTAYGTIPQAVEAVRLGAADYLTKPLDSPRALRQAVRRALGGGRAASSAAGTAAEDADAFLTRDPATLEVLALADRAAATDATVLVRGESGTGKEVLARRIHRRSPRAAAPFVAVNAAALPESLAESELFGHEKGAFTGAVSRHLGRFEQAAGGTLFLDEVGELSEAVQAKLLRALEERSIERIGGERPIAVELRLIAATHRDLARDVEAGRFRADLFYRLHVVALELPPLRRRVGDLELLTERLLERLAGELGVAPRPLSPAAWDRLRGHAWPGNVRELRNRLQRADLLAVGAALEPADLELERCGALSSAVPANEAADEAEPSDLTPEELAERRRVERALVEAEGVVARAAETLGISRQALYRKMDKLGVALERRPTGAWE